MSPMPRRLRFVPAGSLVEVTCRTVQGRLLLRPSTVLRDLTLGVLARAARLYPVEVHGFAFLSNHYHLLLTVPDAQRLSRFMNYLNSNLAREAGRLVRWREKFWGRRYQAILVSDEEAAQVGRLRYVLAHGVKEGLVSSPLEWPGAHCAKALLEGTDLSGRWIDRTLEYAAKRRRRSPNAEDAVSIETLRLTSLPCWRALSEQTRKSRLRVLLTSVEEEAREERRRAGAPPLGKDSVLSPNPRHVPNQVEKRPAPIAHAVSRAARSAFRDAYGSFLSAYRQACEELRASEAGAAFPAGSFPPAMPFRPP